MICLIGNALLYSLLVLCARKTQNKLSLTVSRQLEAVKQTPSRRASVCAILRSWCEVLISIKSTLSRRVEAIIYCRLEIAPTPWQTSNGRHTICNPLVSLLGARARCFDLFCCFTPMFFAYYCTDMQFITEAAGVCTHSTIWQLTRQRSTLPPHSASPIYESQCKTKHFIPRRSRASLRSS